MKMRSNYESLNVGEEDQLLIAGYRLSKIGIILFVILVVLSGGMLLLIIAWKPSVRVRITHKRCTLDQANAVLIKDRFGGEYVETVEIPAHSVNVPGNCIHFFHKKIKYIWRNELNHFVKLRGLESYKCGILYSLMDGLTGDEASLRSQLYGLNSVLIEIKPIWKLILEEITGPFYLYQIFIFIIWMIQLYYQFSICVLMLSIFSVSLHVWQTRKQSIALRKKVDSESEVKLIRDGSVVKRMSRDLVPGDVIMLSVHSQSFTMECDAVLMNGSCSLDESMLTGESVPISKVGLTDHYDSLYSPTTHKNNTLFCGTQVLTVQAIGDTYVKAIVVRTGFSTTKGELVRSFLFPKSLNFKLKIDLMKCMTIFLAFGIPCMAYTAYRFYYLGESSSLDVEVVIAHTCLAFDALYALVRDIVIIVVDVATFLVPPLLPAVMTSINAHAQRRLKKKGLFCLNPNAISGCGGLDVMCFDKTGTLTEDSIDFSGVVPVVDNEFSQPIRYILELPADNRLVLSLATCHSLSQHDGKVDGENLDIKLFEATDWQFVADIQSIDERAFERIPERMVAPKDISNQFHDNSILYGIVKQLPFESVLQRMLVIICPAFDRKYIVIVKGAPEVIVSLCNQTSIPEDYSNCLESYTRDGLRVLATASKEIYIDLESVVKMSRDQLETDLHFDGFVVFQNKLKRQTNPVLKVLKKADIRTVMLTGDNLLTSISVARECAMIAESDSVIKVEAQLDQSSNENQALRVFYTYAKLPGFSEKLRNGGLEESLLPLINPSDCYHLALEGKTFDLIRHNDQKLLNKIAHKGTIFARMSPEHKLSLIRVLQEQGHQVGMCGDGANDCGALRTANAGISLSVAEASVASPFTYRDKDISCVPILIAEGRATLSATIGAFKYQVCYCFALLAAVLILFWDGNKPSDGAYVFVDIILNILPPIVFGTTAAYPVIVKRLPTRTILSFLPQFSMYSFILFQILLYLLVRYITTRQTWYEPFHFSPDRTHVSEPSQITFAIFSVNMVSYVISAVIFSPGPPYRKNIFTNKMYLLVVLINLALVSCVTLFPPQFVFKLLNFKDIPTEFKLVLFTISILNFILSYVWEVLVLQGVVFSYILPKLRALRPPIHPFDKLEEELKSSDGWPPISSERLKQISEESREDSARRLANPGHTARSTANTLIMRSISTDEELNPYYSSFINRNDLESPLEQQSNQKISFSTFVDGRRVQNSEAEHDFNG